MQTTMRMFAVPNANIFRRRKDFPLHFGKKATGLILLTATVFKKVASSKMFSKICNDVGLLCRRPRISLLFDSGQRNVFRHRFDFETRRRDSGGKE